MTHFEVLGLGVFGALVPELLRAVACLRANKAPKRKEILASAIVAVLGSGVLLFDLTDAPAFQVAVLGSAFPQLFTSAVAASTAPVATKVRRGESRGRTVIDYLSWRL